MALEARGYRINTYTDGFTALDSFQTERPDLAILDIKMPRVDGIETLRRLREKSDLPVIFLTSKEEEIDELVGLKMGADDYIRKPFSARLLVERVKLLLRRATPQTAVPKAGSKIVEHGELRLDLERHFLHVEKRAGEGHRHGISHPGGASEQARGAKKPKCVNRCSLRRRCPYDERTIDSHMKRLRKKFKAHDADFDMIQTVYGIGYSIKEL